MFGKLSSKTCAALLFAAGLIISLALAYHLGSKWSWEEVLVPVERIVDARPTQSMWQQNMTKMAGFGTAVFCVGTVISYLAAELYYSVLEFFKAEADKARPQQLSGEWAGRPCKAPFRPAPRSRAFLRFGENPAWIFCVCGLYISLPPW